MIQTAHSPIRDRRPPLAREGAFGPGDSGAPFQVTQISTTDVRGGAARATLRLQRALGGAGVRSRMLVAQRFGDDADVVEFNSLAPAPRMLAQAFFRFGRRWHRPSIRRAGAYFTPDWSFTGWRLASQLPPSDLVNLHWVADLLDYRTLPRLTAQLPVVWTFHDMNAFTGGCHYCESCRRFQDRCGSCPLLMTSSGDEDMTRRILNRKQQVLGRVPPSRLAIVCPSEWLAAEALRSTLFRNFNVHTIPNGIDLREYRPMARAEARARLQLPPEARIVLFVAERIEDQRKGFALLQRALEALRDLPRLLLVTLGSGPPALHPPPAVRHLGVLNDSAQLRAAYSAADVFAIPSLQDNLPNTILESMACGTPVVGFAAGGVREAVADGQTGLLAPTGDAAALAAALHRLLEDGALQRTFAAAARDRAEREYDINLQARRYAALYRDLLGPMPPGGFTATPCAA